LALTADSLFNTTAGFQIGEACKTYVYRMNCHCS
jgi:hypothetical protein